MTPANANVTASMTTERPLTKTTSSLSDDKKMASTNSSNMTRSGSIRDVMKSLFYSPMAKKDFDGNPAVHRYGSQETEPVPSLDGDDDFSDGEEEQHTHAQSATEGSVRGMPKSATMNNLSDFSRGGDGKADKGKGKEKDKDKEGEKGTGKSMRKSRSTDELEKEKGRARASSLFDEKHVGAAFAFTTDMGSDVELGTQEHGKVEVVAGSVNHLINFLTPTGRVDSEFITDFFFSYRYFIEAPELLDQLILRFVEYTGSKADGKLFIDFYSKILILKF